MNLLQLVLKQMRQRALGSWLTLLSVLLGVGLAVSIMVLRQQSGELFGQTDYGYDVLVGAKGSPLQLVLNTVYHIDRSPGNIPYSMYEDLEHSPTYRPHVRLAIPFAVGDSYMGHRIVGTLPQLFGVDDAGKPMDPAHVMEYRPDLRYEIDEGKVFGPDKFEAIVGSDIPKRTGLKLGDQFQATHGLPGPNEIPDIHKPKWTVVGVLKPTHTAADRVLFIPLISFYTIAEHDVGQVAHEAIREGKDPEAAIKALNQSETTKASSKPAAAAPGEDLLTPKTAPALVAPKPADDDDVQHYTLDSQGRIQLDLPKNIWEVSGVMVKSRSPFAASALMYSINNGQIATAVNPASTMREFFSIFLDPTTRVLGAVSYLVTIVAAVGILVSIYNSVSARLREIAILRALGATRVRILSLICIEAGIIGLVGGVLGLLAGHLLCAVASAYLKAYIGQGIAWWMPSASEGWYLLAVVILATLAGLIPALKAYSTPVATNLVAS